MTHRFAWLTFLGSLCLVFAVGCDEETTDPDGGGRADTGPPGVDSGMDRVDSGGGGTDAGTDAGGGGSDAGDGGSATADSGVDTGSCAAAAVTIMETCPAVAPCEDDVVGAWCYSNICIQEDEIIPASAASQCPDGISFENVSGMVTGRVEFTATEVARTVATTVDADIRVAASCLDGFLFTCPNIQIALREALASGGTADCALAAGGDCVCDVTFGSNIDTIDPYTKAGSRITVAPGSSSERQFDYCVESPNLSYRDVSEGDILEPGVATLTPET